MQNTTLYPKKINASSFWQKLLNRFVGDVGLRRIGKNPIDLSVISSGLTNKKTITRARAKRKIRRLIKVLIMLKIMVSLLKRSFFSALVWWEVCWNELLFFLSIQDNDVSYFNFTAHCIDFHRFDQFERLLIKIRIFFRIMLILVKTL